MTRKYCLDRLLPIYTQAFQKARLQRKGELKPQLSQEYNHPSHGNRRRELAQLYLQSSAQPNISYPAQSPRT